MKISLSPRLKMCCDFVAPGSRIADVGCDHGYLSIYLILQGIARSAIAADIKQMPLLSAKRNAKKYGVEDKMEFYLSDGVQSLPRDFDALVCAGVGGDTMVSILEAAPWLKDERYRVVLQCQSKTHLLRRYLSENGWRIYRERLTRDGKFLYTAMDIGYAPGHALTPGQWYLSPALLESGCQELEEYRQNMIRLLSLAAEGEGKHPEPEQKIALEQLRQLSI